MSRLQELRKKYKYTQVQVQMISGVDQSDFSKLERGVKNMSFEQCKALAIAFNTSMDYLAGITDEVKPYPRNFEIEE